MTDIDKILEVSKRWSDVDTAPGGLIAFDDVNSLLELTDRLEEELARTRTSLRRAEAATRATKFSLEAERALSKQYEQQLALRDAVLEELWSGAVDPSVTERDFGLAVGAVLAAWYDREGGRPE